MADTWFVDILNARNKLLVHSDCSFLVESLMWHYIIEELTILAILHDQEKFAFSLNNFVKLDYVRVPNLFKDLDLSAYSLDILLIFDTWLLQDLYSNLKKQFKKNDLAYMQIKNKDGRAILVKNDDLTNTCPWWILQSYLPFLQSACELLTWLFRKYLYQEPSLYSEQ